MKDLSYLTNLNMDGNNWSNRSTTTYCIFPSYYHVLYNQTHSWITRSQGDSLWIKNIEEWVVVFVSLVAAKFRVSKSALLKVKQTNVLIGSLSVSPSTDIFSQTYNLFFFRLGLDFPPGFNPDLLKPKVFSDVDKD